MNKKFWKGIKVRIMKSNLFFDFMKAMEAAKEGLQFWKEETFDVECPGEKIDKDYLLEEYAKEIVLAIAETISCLFEIEIEEEDSDEDVETEFAITEFEDSGTKQLDLFYASDITDEKVVAKITVEDAENVWNNKESKITEAVENWMRETNIVSGEWVEFD